MFLICRRFFKRKPEMGVVCVACFMFGLIYSRYAENLYTKHKGLLVLEDKRNEKKIVSRDSIIKIPRNEILNSKTILKNSSVKHRVKRPVNQQKNRFKQNEQSIHDLFIFRMKDHRNVSGVNPRQCTARHQDLWRTCINIRNNQEKCNGETCLCYNGGWWFEKPRFTNFSRLANNILEQERKLLYEPPIDDVKKLPDPRKSKLQLIAPKAKNIYSYGDVIKVRVDLYNSFGDVMTRGGDDVRAWMVGGQEGSKRVSGEVNDLRNGSYEVSFQTWWGGQNEINVALVHERELLATHFRWRRQFFSLFLHRAVYKYQNKTIYTTCGEYPELPFQNGICNFTNANGGLPWFCGRPNIPELHCDDLEHVEMFNAINIPMTEPEFQASTRRTCKMMINNHQEIQVNIGGNSKDIPEKNALPACSKIPREMTWNISEMTSPTGYYKNGTWIPRDCYIPHTKENLMTCFNNLSIILSGDSTIRQWYSTLKMFTNCKQTSQKWSKAKWFDNSHCVINRLDFSLSWICHNLPFVLDTFNKTTKHFNHKSVRSILEKVPTSGRYLLVIHFFAHRSRIHHSHFRQEAIQVKLALRDHLNKNPDLMVAFKGFHAFYEGGCPDIYDYAGVYFFEILKEELREFWTRVWYINYWDMTIAAEDNYYKHLPESEIWQQLRLLFGYVCK